MKTNSRPPGQNPTAEHRKLAEAFEERARRLEAVAHRYSMTRLVAFVGAAVLLIAGFSQDSALWLWVGGALTAVFALAVALHLRVLARVEGAEVRAAVHRRHLLRIDGRFDELPLPRADLMPSGHPYASDLDLLGRGSLFQRLDTTQTREGERTLVEWLCAPADPATIEARQRAVSDLRDRLELRQELEAAALGARGVGKLDGGPFMAFVLRPSYFAKRPWMKPLIHAMPLVLVALFVGSRLDMVPEVAWLVWLVLQAAFAFVTAAAPKEAFELVAARRSYVESFARTFAVAEEAPFEAPLLKDVQGRLKVQGRNPSHFLNRLDRWAGLAELHTQFPIHFFVNIFVLWDLHVLERLEAWNKDVGHELGAVFSALGELEALSALGSFYFTESGSMLPEIAAAGSAFEAEAIAHPLLPADRRVANDVRLAGEGSALIVTGSNMAGKSTLLRAVGLNIALALAGGSVVARRFSLPPLRLRASMRIDDSLQEGASYFHAELTRLRSVVDAAEEGPPVFFLLDELLRGTNARARHLGGRYVLLHLLDRRAMGLVATHDVALSELADERPEHVRNVHFTDVMRDGVMLFDYRLRDGVVRTSNALRLLSMAGIHVPEDAL